MNMRSTIKFMLLMGTMTCFALMSGCGGEGGNNTNSTNPYNLTLTAANIPAGVQLGALKATITVPTGVSIPTDNTGQVAAGAIVAIGVASTGTSQALGNFQGSTRKLTISLVSTAGIGNGDYLAVTFDVNNGTTVTAADFPVIIDEAKDNGPTYGPVAGVTVTAR